MRKHERYSIFEKSDCKIFSCTVAIVLCLLLDCRYGFSTQLWATLGLQVLEKWMLIHEFYKILIASLICYLSLCISKQKFLWVTHKLFFIFHPHVCFFRHCTKINLLYNREMKVKVTQSCPALCNPMHYIVHGILQARKLEWVSFPFSRGSSQPRDWTQVSCIFTSWATRGAQEYWSG